MLSFQNMKGEIMVLNCDLYPQLRLQYKILNNWLKDKILSVYLGESLLKMILDEFNFVKSI